MWNWSIKCICFVFIVGLLLNSALALYEDEIGKYDWTRQFVGRVQHLEFEQHQQHQPGSTRRFFVSTDHSVIAAIGLKSSRIVWRHFLEEAAIHDIKLCGGALFSISNGLLRAWSTNLGTMEYELSVQETGNKTFSASLVCHRESEHARAATDLLFVSTPHQTLAVRPHTGAVVWTANLTDGGTEVTSFHHTDGLTVATLDTAGSANKVHVHRFGSESAVAKRTVSVPADWLASLDRCAISTNTMACVDDASSVRLLSLVSGDTFQPLSGSVSQQLGTGPWLKIIEVGAPDVYQLTGAPESPVATLDASLATVPTVEQLPAGSLLRYCGSARFLLRQRATTSDSPTTASNDATLEASGQGSVTISLAGHHGPVVGLHPVTFARRIGAGGYGYRVVVATRDADLHAFDDSGERQWSREESLAGIVSVEAVDLPAADQDELVTPGGSVLSSFAQRLVAQLHHAASLLTTSRRHHQQQHQPGGGASSATEESAASSEDQEPPELTRDEFNLRKLLVVVTREGKVAGLDSASGRPVWRLLVPGAQPLARGQMPLFVQRTTAHFPLEPLATVLYRHAATGLPALLSFNPVTGAALGPPMRFPSRLLQALLVPQPSHEDGQYVRPLLLLSDTLQVTVYPAKTPLPRGFRLINVFTVDTDNRLLQGYRIRPSDEAAAQSSLTASSTWRLALHETILATAARRPTEHVHSVGRVLGNRHVLYKYLNPNLLAVATQANDIVTPAPAVGDAFSQITVSLIDTVSGRVVASATHQHSCGPISLVHSEHWLVYSLWNQKQRRFQLSVWELFASGLHECMNASRPLVSRQAYILPAPVQQLAVTQTERGITAKALLLALRSGGIMELNKAYLDPRRPFEMTPEFQEEGLVPYHPEVPMSTQSIVNYNHSLHRLTGIVTVPTGLESTSLLFAYGTDLFCTRVQPSKMFDVLKTDFDYLFIGAVTIGMIVGSFVTQKLAARKALFRQWS